MFQRLNRVLDEEGSKSLHLVGIENNDVLEVRPRTKDDMKRLEHQLTSQASVKRMKKSTSTRALTYDKDTDDAQQLFGKPLWRIIERERDLGRQASVPFIVESLCDVMRAKHLKESGLFRVSGQTIEVSIICVFCALLYIYIQYLKIK